MTIIPLTKNTPTPLNLQGKQESTRRLTCSDNEDGFLDVYSWMFSLYSMYILLEAKYLCLTGQLDWCKNNMAKVESPSHFTYRNFRLLGCLGVNLLQKWDEPFFRDLKPEKCNNFICPLYWVLGAPTEDTQIHKGVCRYLLPFQISHQFEQLSAEHPPPL